jgi:hypothetical protein
MAKALICQPMQLLKDMPKSMAQSNNEESLRWTGKKRLFPWETAPRLVKNLGCMPKLHRERERAAVIIFLDRGDFLYRYLLVIKA